MKTRIFIACALVAALNSFAIAGAKPAEAEKDSIILTFGSKTRLIIYGESREELEKVMKYDLNALLRDLKVKLDSSSGRDTTFLAEEIDGKKYRTNGSDGDYVRIGLRGVHVKEGTTEVKIDADGVSVKDDTDNDSEYRRTGTNSGPGKKFYRSSPGSSPRKGFTFALGLNAYGMNEPQGYIKENYDLKPFGSRYVSLGYIASTRIARGKNASLHLDFGADFSWYNLMFDGNNTVQKDVAGYVTFKPFYEDENSTVERELKKSKLVIPNVNLSLMPTLSFRRGFISHFSAGAYGGYRLGSYTKTQVQGSKDKDHVRTNFYINDFRYGLAAEIGFRHFVDLFVNYDLNNLYEDGRGPKIRMISFGIRL